MSLSSSRTRPDLPETLVAPFSRLMQTALESKVIARIWDRDHTVWKPDPTEISNRLGWLDLPSETLRNLTALTSFADKKRAEGIEDVVLLGMGGSSLCPLVFSRILGPAQGCPNLHVLDSTVPDWVVRVENAIKVEKTLFLVSSKSGGTIEVMSAFRYFWEKVSEKSDHPGNHFAAITDPGTSLKELAESRGFSAVFENNPDVGGRFSALSYFGMVPAALMGLPVRDLLTAAQSLAEDCRSEDLAVNPGAALGLFLTVCAEAGREKLSLISSPGLSSLGLWIEQLLAESTGKEGKGILPIAEEPEVPVECYGNDRMFVLLRKEGDSSLDQRLIELKQAGHPVLVLDVEIEKGIGAEFFRWEFATAVVSHFLGIHPFDQPNVQLAKTKTSEVLAKFKNEGALDRVTSPMTLGEMLSQAKPGNYLAIMAYVDESPEVESALSAFRKWVTERHHIATTCGYGPRFLHSTGQYHKGGPNNGLFLQWVPREFAQVPIPGETYDFAVLCEAQAIGDLQALTSKGRTAICVRLGSPVAEHLLETANIAVAD